MVGQRLTEFYEERQGRPFSKVAQDMETRLPSVSRSSITKIVNQLIEEAMKAELEEIVSKLTAALAELQQIKLHLASMSDAHVEGGEEE